LKFPGWKNLADFVGMVAIVIGIFLVFEELRQARTVARAELSAESARLFDVLLAQERDPQFAAVLVKSRQTPDDLSPSERVRLNSFLTGLLLIYVREYYNYQRGIFETWEDYIVGTAPAYFGVGYGRAFWQVQREVWGGEIGEAIDRALENTDSVEFYRNLDAEIVYRLQHQ
jgi:hypothetical protein